MSATREISPTGGVKASRAGPNQAAMIKLFKVKLPENQVFIENVLPPAPNDLEPAQPDFYHFRMRA